MPTEAEIDAASEAMWKSHLTDNHIFGGPDQDDNPVTASMLQSIRDMARVALEAAEAVRAVPRNPGKLPITKITPDE